jgi:hypothetical protein
MSFWGGECLNMFMCGNTGDVIDVSPLQTFSTMLNNSMLYRVYLLPNSP